MRDELITKHMEFITESTSSGFTTLVRDDRYDGKFIFPPF